MVSTCAALGCKVRYVKGMALSFHSFPTDIVRRIIWTLALKRENFKVTNHTKICSKHFSPECFDTEAFGFGRKLKRDAVPSIFDFPPPVATKGWKKVPQFERNTLKVSSAWESKMYFTHDLPPKRQRAAKKPCICDCQREIVNLQKGAKNNLQDNKRKCLHRQKSRRAIKNLHTNETAQSFLRQKQMTSESIAEMSEVDLNPYIFCVKVKQELETHDNEFVEDGLVTTECSVVIKEEPELELGVDVIENGVLREPLQTSVCTDNIKEEPESNFEVEDNADAFAEVFVPTRCLSSIKKEEVFDNVWEPQIVSF